MTTKYMARLGIARPGDAWTGVERQAGQVPVADGLARHGRLGTAVLVEARQGPAGGARRDEVCRGWASLGRLGIGTSGLGPAAFGWARLGRRGIAGLAASRHGMAGLEWHGYAWSGLASRGEAGVVSHGRAPSGTVRQASRGLSGEGPATRGRAGTAWPGRSRPVRARRDAGTARCGQVGLGLSLCGGSGSGEAGVA